MKKMKLISKLIVTIMVSFAATCACGVNKTIDCHAEEICCCNHHHHEVHNKIGECTEHNLSWASDGVYHWQECTNDGCDYETEKAKHDKRGFTAIYNNGHEFRCTTCGGWCEWTPHEHVFKCAEVVDNDCTNQCKVTYECICGDYITKYENYYTGHDFIETFTTDETYHWHICSHEGCGVTYEKEQHTFGEITEEPSCTEQTIYRETCTVCGYLHQYTKTEKDVRGHLYVYVPEVKATEDTKGIYEHYECSDCHRLFTKDEETGKYKFTTLTQLTFDYKRPSLFSNVALMSFLGAGLLVTAGVVIVVVGTTKKKHK